MKKILYVIHDFLPKHLAGSELYTYYIAKGLQDRGHEINIYTREHGHFDRQFTDEDSYYDGLKVKTIYFNAPPSKINLDRFKSLNSKFDASLSEQRLNHRINEFKQKFYFDFYNPLIAKHFDRYLDEIKPDIVHFQHLIGLSASFIRIAKKKGIPCLLTTHDYWFMCSTIQLIDSATKRCSGPLHGLKCAACLAPNINPHVMRGLFSLPLFIRTFYLKYLLSQLDLIISPSQFLRDKFIEHGVSKRKFIFSDNGMPTKAVMRKQRPFNQKLRFGFIGSVMPNKGVHVLIEAFNKMKNGSAELLVYGDPGYAPDYYKRITEMATHPQIKFMGRYENNQVYKVLSEIDALVVPSIWYENSPITIHEAALAGVPIIASNIGGMDELVERFKNGIVFQVEDANDLYDKMNLLIDKPDFLEQLKCKAEEIKTIDENVRELEGIYFGLIEKR